MMGIWVSSNAKHCVGREAKCDVQTSIAAATAVSWHYTTGLVKSIPKHPYSAFILQKLLILGPNLSLICTKA